MKNIFLIILSIISIFGLWLLWLSFTFVTSFNSVCLSYRLNPTIDHSKNLDNFAQCLDSIPDKHNNLDYRCHLPHNKCSVNFSYSCNVTMDVFLLSGLGLITKIQRNLHITYLK